MKTKHDCTPLAFALLTLTLYGACVDAPPVRSPQEAPGCRENNQCSARSYCVEGACRAPAPCGAHGRCPGRGESCVSGRCLPPAPDPDTMLINVMYRTALNPNARLWPGPVDFAFWCGRVGERTQARFPSEDLDHAETGRIVVPWPTACGSTREVLDIQVEVFTASVRCAPSRDAQPVAYTPLERRVATVLLDCIDDASEAK